MKPRFANQSSHALTLVEVLVVIAVVAFLALLFLSLNTANHIKQGRISCINNLKQIGLAYRIWPGDNGGIYPMGISITNGSSMEMVVTGNVVQTFEVMSNELGTPKILVCPQDTNHIYAVNFSGLSNSNVSYFVGVDTTNEMHPQMIVSGDSNFKIGGVPVKSGLLELSLNTPVTWATTRHEFGGNIGFADGSVQPANNSGLTKWLQQTGLATNRLAIP